MKGNGAASMTCPSEAAPALADDEEDWTIAPLTTVRYAPATVHEYSSRTGEDAERLLDEIADNPSTGSLFDWLLAEGLWSPGEKRKGNMSARTFQAACEVGGSVDSLAVYHSGRAGVSTGYGGDQGSARGAANPDLLPFDGFVVTGTPADARVNVWLGCPGVAIAPHHDASHNFFVQLSGAKRFWLAAAGTLNPTYPRGHPYFRSYRPTTPFDLSLDLHPGDVLYLPPYTVHHVETVGEEISVSVNVFSTSTANDRYTTATHDVMVPFEQDWDVTTAQAAVRRYALCLGEAASIDVREVVRLRWLATFPAHLYPATPEAFAEIVAAEAAASFDLTKFRDRARTIVDLLCGEEAQLCPILVGDYVDELLQWPDASPLLLARLVAGP